jgi:hypothetical protein
MPDICLNLEGIICVQVDGEAYSFVSSTCSMTST